MYADDTHTTIASSDIAELICMPDKEMLYISDWLRVKKLSANPQKTEFTIIGHQRRINLIKYLSSLELNDCEIQRVEKLKSLGIIVDEGLTWTDQFKSFMGKLAAGLSFKKNLWMFFPSPCYVMSIMLSFRVTYTMQTQYGGAYCQLK